MEKITLKLWQKILLFSVLGILVFFVVLNVVLNQVDSKKRIPVSVQMNVDVQPNDSTTRLFNDEKTTGDTIRFETIRGANEGWIFQIFSVGLSLDYSLFIDFRDTKHLWKKGDSLIFTQNIPGLKKECPPGILKFMLQSNLNMGNNSFITDDLYFSKYYLSLHCRRLDSLASFDGVFYAEEYLKNPEESPEKMVLTGSFQADSIKPGRRVVN